MTFYSDPGKVSDVRAEGNSDDNDNDNFLNDLPHVETGAIILLLKYCQCISAKCLQFY